MHYKADSPSIMVVASHSGREAAEIAVFSSCRDRRSLRDIYATSGMIRISANPVVGYTL
jgi:hypothetical protein